MSSHGLFRLPVELQPVGALDQPQILFVNWSSLTLNCHQATHLQHSVRQPKVERFSHIALSLKSWLLGYPHQLDHP